MSDSVGQAAADAELDGLVLPESDSPVMVFETGLPTRYYFNRTDGNLAQLVSTETETECPYKGTTSQFCRDPRGGRTARATAKDAPSRTRGSPSAAGAPARRRR